MVVKVIIKLAVVLDKEADVEVNQEVATLTKKWQMLLKSFVMSEEFERP